MGTARLPLRALVQPAALGQPGGDWAPLYADRETGPADAELRAIKVSPIPERIGQRLAMALRESFNPEGAPSPQRYRLDTLLTATRSDLGIQQTGLGTRGKLDATVSFWLRDIKTGTALLANSVHTSESFDILANNYASIVADEDARIRAAGELPSRSALRRAFEEAAHAAAIGCYADNARDLAAVIRDTFAAHRIAISRDAVAFLVEHLGGDRLLTRAELEKLTLYAGAGGRIELADAQAVISDSAALSLDDAVLAAAEGDAAALDRALARVFQEGESAVTVIRALLRHLHRLHVLSIQLTGGGSIDNAIRNARPPIFFKQQDR